MRGIISGKMHKLILGRIKEEMKIDAFRDLKTAEKYGRGVKNVKFG